jgi:hypothetical protein
MIIPHCIHVDLGVLLQKAIITQCASTFALVRLTPKHVMSYLEQMNIKQP